MKNMKVGKKLIVGFLLVVVFSVVVGAVGIFGMLSITQKADDMYYNQLLSIEYLAIVKETLVSMRVDVREMIIGSSNDDQTKVSDRFRQIEAAMPKMTEYMGKYEAKLVAGSEQATLFKEARSLYENELVNVVMSVHSAARDENMDEMLRQLAECNRVSVIIISNFEQCMELKVQDADDAMQAATALSTTLLIAIIAVIVIVVIASMALALYISGLIAKPLTAMATALSELGTRGNIKLDPELAQKTQECANNKDEVGDCAKAFGSMIRRFTGMEQDLIRIADGDLTVQVETLSPDDGMGISMKKMVDSLNNMFGEINSSTVQVSSGSKQIADSAQALASGSTEQAATVEQLSASIQDISDKTKSNAQMAGKAANLANEIKIKAETGSRQMDDMVNAVNEINQASQSISKVIKVIDDIAFQTNILALNAAVEAARAGQHGKGFAVVAEEVRNLAGKSAEAAKDTGGLIANSMEKSELGARIAQETAASLAEIVEGINESTKIVSEISTSSEEQSYAVEQINSGLNQVSMVIQQNSATAEQSAAASEEMSGQSNMLEDLVGQFKLKD